MAVWRFGVLFIHLVVFVIVELFKIGIIDPRRNAHTHTHGHTLTHMSAHCVVKCNYIWQINCIGHMYVHRTITLALVGLLI